MPGNRKKDFPQIIKYRATVIRFTQNYFVTEYDPTIENRCFSMMKD